MYCCGNTCLKPVHFINISALSSPALVSPIVVNPSWPVGSGAHPIVVNPLGPVESGAHPISVNLSGRVGSEAHPIVVNPSGPVESGAPNRLGRCRPFSSCKSPYINKPSPGVLEWVACFECSDSVVNCMFTAGSLTGR